MKLFWICALLLVSHAFADEFDYEDYDSYFEYPGDLDKLISEEKSTHEKTDLENDLKVEEDIQEFQAAAENSKESKDKPKDTIDRIDDYQFEDNRDKSKENNDDKKNADSVVDSGDDSQKPVQDDYNAEENRPEDHNQNEDYALLWGDDNIAPLPVPDDASNDNDDEAILEETRQILQEDGASKFEDDDIKAQEEDADQFEQEIRDQLGNLDVNEETRKILEEDSNKFQDDVKSQIDDSDRKENKEKEILDDFNVPLAKNELSDEKDDENKLNADVENKEQSDLNVAAVDINSVSDEDTVNKVYADLNADLDKLFETLDKLQDNSSEDKDKIAEMEKQVDAIFDNWGGENFDDNNIDGSNEFDESEDGNKEFNDILNDMKAENNAVVDMDLTNDEINEPNPVDSSEKDAETFDTDMGRIIFGNDALVDTEAKDNEINTNNDTTPITEETTKATEVKTVLVKELNSAELEDLVSQFSILHSEDLNVHAESFDKNVAPVRIALKVDEPTIITSPDYPNPYPTNNIVDWILTGDGVGIELNITDFTVNGALGDYLLIKPGGIDESGHEGILFTYRLTSERRYRFTDVDRVFLRFESKPGMMFFKGFSLSARMIALKVSTVPVIPTPEPIKAPPHSTTTVYLATSVIHFQDVKEDFLLLLTDMADEYIRTNDVEPGLNATSEVTQVTSVHLCPVSWPNFENCAAVTFGIPLVYEDDEDLRLNAEDLNDMWRDLIGDEPFARRLSKMGLAEFEQPSAAALMSWVLVTGAVVVCMCLLALALWRYSCLQGYTRMQADSDTWSVAGKGGAGGAGGGGGGGRGGELFPTPHQALPPLYAHTTVDMGGFANKSYTSDNMYDFESDEDIVLPRDRNGAANSRDISNA